ncbi:MAG: radical SAM/SPASM domain-containing protein [bacterium]
MNTVQGDITSFKNTRFGIEVKKLMLLSGLKLVVNKNPMRKLLINTISNFIRDAMIEDEVSCGSNSLYVARVESQFLINLLKQAIKNMDKGYLSKDYVGKFVNSIVKPPMKNESVHEIVAAYKNKYGIEPPRFVTISPTQNCNLKCIGCYAASHPGTKASLPYSVVKRLVQEMHDLAGSRFIVISGGEPFMWKDSGKDIISLAEEFDDMFFLVYTNGTVMDESRLRRLKEAANITPAISVEGYEEQTDRRRGKGVYNRILNTIDQLKKYGILFGVSVTATSENVDILLEDRFYEYWLEDIGATYMWMFHLMPIGRAKDTMGLMVTPEQREKLTLKWEHIVFEKEYFVGDFWDAGAASHGCMAYGRSGGYFYVDWNGNIMPCVFVPFYKDNIYDLYKNDKTIIDALMSNFFIRGRRWQKEYGYLSDPPGNYFAPCSIRDNHKDFREKILTEDAKPEDENAQLALEDPEYYAKMVEFGIELHRRTGPLWKDRIKDRIKK